MAVLRHTEVSAIVLAGGRGRRLGKTKALVNIHGKTLLERVIERLRPLASQLMLVTSLEQAGRLATKAAKDTEVLVDRYPGGGSLIGICTGLMAARYSHSIVVACDMPFLNTELLRYLIELTGDFDAVVPRLGEGRAEPLHAIYSRSCLDTMNRQLERNQLSVHAVLDSIRVRYVERAECQRLDPQLLSFFNINYPADLDRAASLAMEEGC